MAKKRKKDKTPQEEYEFKPPDFDEKEFLLKELRDTKTVLLTVAYAALFGLIAGIVSNLNEDIAVVGLVLVFAGLFSLKYFYPYIKVDTSQFQKKNWAGNVAWFFFTFLAIWVLTFNFPIADHADPDVEDITVWVSSESGVIAIDYEYVDSIGGYSWVPRDDVSLDSILQANPNYTVNITARVTDNGNLIYARIAVNGGPWTNMTAEGDHRFGWIVGGDSLSASLMFEIMAGDEADHVTVFRPVSGIPVSG